MPVRIAAIRDLTMIRALPLQLGAVSTEILTGKRLSEMLLSPDYVAAVHIAGVKRSGCIGIQFLPEISVKGNFAVITFFAVNRAGYDWKIAGEIEDYADEIGRANYSSCLLSQCN
jgi:hypothetical protein